MTNAMYIFFLGLGSLVGSFLNVCIYRIPRGESVVSPSSKCPDCGSRLQFIDLVPVASYLLLHRRCRYCRAKISPGYIMIELLTGLMYLASWHRFGMTPNLITALILVPVLIVAAMIDLRHYRIPNQVVLAGTAFALLLMAGGYLEPLESLKGMLVGGLPLFFLVVTTKGMGAGDAKLGAMVGLYLGWEKVFLALMIASALAAVVGISAWAAGLRKWREPLPFGPFISIGALAVFYGGGQIIGWYLHLFG